jgi:hypothetical protein
LADSDQKAINYLQGREYQRQLAELPALISNLGKSTLKFNDFKEPFKAALNYAWDAVVNKGFKMDLERKYKMIIFKKGKANTRKIEPVWVCLRKKDDNVSLNDLKGSNYSEYTLSELFITPAKNNTLNPSEDFNIVLGKLRNFYDGSDVKFKKLPYCASSEWFLNSLIKSLEHDEERLFSFSKLLKTTLMLPSIMNDYLRITQRKLVDAWNDVAECLPKSENGK